jgi:hypothetical protein
VFSNYHVPARARLRRRRNGGERVLARIYQPAKNAMQSGKARTRTWVLEFEPERAREIEPLMGWTTSADMRQQVSLDFDSVEEAVAYAQKNGIPYHVYEPHQPAPKAKSYSDNFRFDRKIPWSH